jgi:hypothetical protein
LAVETQQVLEGGSKQEITENDEANSNAKGANGSLVRSHLANRLSIDSGHERHRSPT